MFRSFELREVDVAEPCTANYSDSPILSILTSYESLQKRAYLAMATSML